MKPRHRGFSSIYMVFLLLPLIGFVSFAVDMGRIRLGQSQLQAGADAGARAGAWGLPTSTADVQDRATQIADANHCLGQAIALDRNADIQFGIWSAANRTFTPLT